MKFYIRCDEGDYAPPRLDWGVIHLIQRTIEDKVKDRFARRYKDIDVSFENVNFDESECKMNVLVYNKGSVKKAGLFEFHQYPDYFEKSDHTSHMNVTISQFVKSL